VQQRAQRLLRLEEPLPVAIATSSEKSRFSLHFSECRLR
jgi:hypothetical protein